MNAGPSLKGAARKRAFRQESGAAVHTETTGVHVCAREKQKKRGGREVGGTLRCPISALSESACATSAADTKEQTELTRGERLRRTHCSSSRRSCRRSRSGCHTSSGPECSCYSRSGIHEVRRSFHLFSSGANKQTARWKCLQRAWILIGKPELSGFSTRNQSSSGFPRATLTPSSKRRALWRPTHREMKYLTALPISLKRRPPKVLWRGWTFPWRRKTKQNKKQKQKQDKPRKF